MLTDVWSLSLCLVSYFLTVEFILCDISVLCVVQSELVNIFLYRYVPLHIHTFARVNQHYAVCFVVRLAVHNSR
jgi:hypothetical protein